MRSLRRLLTVSLLILLPGAVLADAKKPTFDEDVLPVLKQHCVNCHGNDKQRGGLNVATFAATMAGGSSGVVVMPGDPDKSRLYSLSAHKEEPKMPPNGNKIPDGHLEIIRLWIEQGGRENAGSKAMVPAKPKVDISLKGASRGKPEGPPPMPQAGKLKLEPIVRTRRPNAVLALAASPWAPLVAVGGQRQVVLYHADTAMIVGVLPFEHGQINSIKFSRNGKMLLVAGGLQGASGKAVLYNIESGEVVTTVGDKETDAILSADLSADQSMIAVGTPTKLIRVYSTADGSLLRETKKHTDWVTAVEFSPDGVLLATGDRNGGVFIWEAVTGREFHSLRGHTAMISDLSWRPDSNVVATASEDNSIRLWEMENGQPIKNWGAHAGGTLSVKYAIDGRIVSTGRDRVTKLWDGNGAVQKQFEALPDLGLQVTVTHDSSRVIAGDWSGHVKAWAIADGRQLATLDPNPLPLAERLSQAQAAVASAEAAQKQATAALSTAQQQAQQQADALAATQATAAKIQADLTAAQKVVADTTAVIGTLTPQVATAKTELDKQQALVPAATQKAAALEVIAPIYAETAKKLQEAAAKAPQNAELAQAAQAADATAKQQQAQLDVAKKALADVNATVKGATEKHAAVVKQLADSQAALANGQKLVADLQPKLKPAQDAIPVAQKAVEQANAAVNAAKAAADQATAALNLARSQFEQLRAAVPTARN